MKLCEGEGRGACVAVSLVVRQEAGEAGDTLPGGETQDFHFNLLAVSFPP